LSSTGPSRRWLSVPPHPFHWLSGNPWLFLLQPHSAQLLQTTPRRLAHARERHSQRDRGDRFHFWQVGSCTNEIAEVRMQIGAGQLLEEKKRVMALHCSSQRPLPPFLHTAFLCARNFAEHQPSDLTQRFSFAARQPRTRTGGTRSQLVFASCHSGVMHRRWDSPNRDRLPLKRSRAAKMRRGRLPTQITYLFREESTLFLVRASLPPFFYSPLGKKSYYYYYYYYSQHRWVSSKLHLPDINIQ
jgi:hypothetical protein